MVLVGYIRCGWIVDLITGNWNKLAPVDEKNNQIDVSKYIK